MNATAPALAPDLVDGLRRLKLAAMRQLAPELLRTAKTQRWTPEELLRTLIEAEITARDASNTATRLKTAAEKAFCALGPTAQAFLTGAAAGNTRLGPEWSS